VARKYPHPTLVRCAAAGIPLVAPPGTDVNGRAGDGEQAGRQARTCGATPKPACSLQNEQHATCSVDSTCSMDSVSSPWAAWAGYRRPRMAIQLTLAATGCKGS